MSPLVPLPGLSALLSLATQYCRVAVAAPRGVRAPSCRLLLFWGVFDDTVSFGCVLFVIVRVLASVARQDPRIHRPVPAGAHRARQRGRVGYPGKVQAQIRGAVLFGVMFGE